MADPINPMQSPFPPNYGPGLSFYNLMEVSAVIGADGNPGMNVVAQTQDLASAIGWMNQSGGRSIALMFVVAVNAAPLRSAIIGAKN